MSASPAAIAILELGKLLEKPRACTADEAIKFGVAERRATDALYADRSAKTAVAASSCHR